MAKAAPGQAERGGHHGCPDRDGRPGHGGRHRRRVHRRRGGRTGCDPGGTAPGREPGAGRSARVLDGGADGECDAGLPEGAAGTPAPPPGIPNPTYFNGVPTVGALFFTTGTQAHFCTASVVDSAPSDLVLTAAHCVSGSRGYATDIAYVPKWHQGVSPYGMWAVRSITVAAGWQRSQDADLDFAFLAVSPPPGTGRPIQAVTGGLRLGVGTGPAHPVTVIGYNDTDNQPIECATDSFEFKPTQLEFYCNSFRDGTSGGPWILHLNPVTGGGTVIGDIGGYEQGGDYPWASYSPYYASPVLRLFRQAELQRP